jgi:hypothetical protein
MMGLNLGRYALSSCVAAAMLAGCGGSQPPIGTPGAMPHSAQSASHAASGRSQPPVAAPGAMLQSPAPQSLSAQRSAFVAQRNDGKSWGLAKQSEKRCA